MNIIQETHFLNINPIGIPTCVENFFHYKPNWVMILFKFNKILEIPPKVNVMPVQLLYYNKLYTIWMGMAASMVISFDEPLDLVPYA